MPAAARVGFPVHRQRVLHARSDSGRDRGDRAAGRGRASTGDLRHAEPRLGLAPGPGRQPAGDAGPRDDDRWWGGKLCGAIARIALTMHALEAASKADPSWIRRVIPGETMEAALAWVPYLIGNERAVASVVDADPAVRQAKKLAEWIRATESRVITKRDVFLALRGSEFKRAADAEPALRLLEECGWIRLAAQEDRRPRRGRPASPSFEVNPAVLTADGTQT
ncbi:MAG: DUF3987 domain-containing protein [Phycisphaeraceae bacterium]|nr:DUF3987 domain-containing protein [Phycisphaeraceae bacterium]